jgi:hypothetical protein
MGWDGGSIQIKKKEKVKWGESGWVGTGKK